MSTFPNSPHLIQGGIVLVDPESWTVQRVISLQYNPETLSRKLEVQGAGGEQSDQSEALRLMGPAVETIELEAELDATDEMEMGPSQFFGVHPRLAALESIINPTHEQLHQSAQLAGAGQLEIIPMESALTLFVWGKHRILPVRLISLSIKEEAFDAELKAIRATVSLGMRVLNVNDLGFAHKGAGLFMNHLLETQKMAGEGTMSSLGVTIGDLG